MEKQYQYQAQEHQLRLWWEQEQIYATDLTAPHILTIDTPPPTVSGSLHIGHIFSYTQTDIIARYLRMQGAEVWYPFGFDDNGLPTERFVEKRRGIIAHQMSRSSFIQTCLDETRVVEDSFKELWERMGLSVDWRFCYKTIDAQTRKISQMSFMRLYEKGFVYRKDEPSLYCTGCRTTVAQAELDDSEQATTFYDIQFADGADGRPLSIATTRPELLPACVALLFHPSDVRYQALRNKEAIVPLFNYTVPILADDQVIPDKGTGLVMCCTFGDTTDIAWYKKHQLPYRPVIGADGRWLSTEYGLLGKKAKEAREIIITALQESRMLGNKRDVTHVVNVHERCKQPIEFLVIQQWFLRILPHKKELRDLADQITWYPSFMKARYTNWVDNIIWDWCLSRQRFFGIPFPAWHCSACKAVLFVGEEQLPIDPQETVWEGMCTSCGGGPVLPDRDVMDTWNSSSLTPYLCKALQTGVSDTVFDGPFMPMAIRPQAHDIIRTWAFYTIAKTWMHSGTIPWKEIIISGHVLSGAGDKLSKSKNNSQQEPDQLLARYPADVVRFWTASGSLGQDVAFSEQQLQQGNRLMVKLWNAYRFIAEYQTGPITAEMLILEPTQTVHQWVLSEMSTCYTQYCSYFARYEFGLALHAIEQCFWQVFCDNYLEIIKDQFFNPECYSETVLNETRAILAQCGLRMLQWYAPFLPYITETLYRELYSGLDISLSLHRTHFSDVQRPLLNAQASVTMDLVLHVVAAVRRGKTELKLSLRTELATLTVCCTEAQRELLHPEVILIQGATRSKQLMFEIGVPRSSFEEHDGLWHALVGIV